MTKVLVTGSAGFIGSNLCESLLAKDFEVTGIDNFCTGNKQNLARIIDKSNFTFIEADLNSSFPINDQQKFDHIYHLASPASPPKYMKLALETMQVNTRVTENLLEHVKKTGGRLLFASTSEIYGDPLEHPQKETYWGNVNPIGPRSVYDEAKRFGETLLALYQRNGWANTAIIRIFNTYGPNLDPNDGRVVSSFLRDALLGKPLQVFGDGTQTRSFCYVSDLVSGITKMMESDNQGPINLGNPNEFTLLELVKKVGQVLGVNPQIEFKELPQDDPKMRKPDIELAKTSLDWDPKIQLAEGLAKTADWMKTIKIS